MIETEYTVYKQSWRDEYQEHCIQSPKNDFEMSDMMPLSHANPAHLQAAGFGKGRTTPITVPITTPKSTLKSTQKSTQLKLLFVTLDKPDIPDQDLADAHP